MKKEKALDKAWERIGETTYKIRQKVYADFLKDFYDSIKESKIRLSARNRGDLTIGLDLDDEPQLDDGFIDIKFDFNDFIDLAIEEAECECDWEYALPRLVKLLAITEEFRKRVLGSLEKARIESGENHK